MTFYEKMGWKAPKFIVQKGNPKCKEPDFYKLEISDHRLFARSDLKALRDHLDELLFGGDE